MSVLQRTGGDPETLTLSDGRNVNSIKMSRTSPYIVNCFYFLGNLMMSMILLGDTSCKDRFRVRRLKSL